MENRSSTGNRDYASSRILFAAFPRAGIANGMKKKAVTCHRTPKQAVRLPKLVETAAGSIARASTSSSTLSGEYS